MRIKKLVSHLPVVGALVVLGLAAWGIAQVPASVRAQSNEGPSQLCRTAVIIDRSGSVGGNDSGDTAFQQFNQDGTRQCRPFDGISACA